MLDNPYLRRVALAYEAFIRRAAELDQPFMLKGSYVTRQYFEHPADRIPGDLDWVYLEPIADVATARALFDEWVTQITELSLPDGVVFRSFRENAFWRSIDYAMGDDFPTVSTDVECWIDGEHFEGLWIDISFNLPIDLPSELLEYRPLQGDTFLIAHTTPLALQVALEAAPNSGTASLQRPFRPATPAAAPCLYSHRPAANATSPAQRMPGRWHRPRPPALAVGR